MNPRGSHLDPTKTFAVLKKAAKSAGMPLIAIGGLAVVAHGVDRYTKDADVLGPPSDLMHLYKAKGLVPTKPLRNIAGTPFFVETFDVEGVPVDVFPVDHPFLLQAARRARSVGVASVVSVEDLLVLKLVAMREKDHLDALSLLAKHEKAIDAKHVARWSKLLSVLDRWRDLRSEHRSGATGW